MHNPAKYSMSYLDKPTNPLTPFFPFSFKEKHSLWDKMNENVTIYTHVHTYTSKHTGISHRIVATNMHIKKYIEKINRMLQEVTYSID